MTSLMLLMLRLGVRHLIKGRKKSSIYNFKTYFDYPLCFIVGALRMAAHHIVRFRGKLLTGRTKHTKTQMKKWEMMNAVMKCGPEKGHWVVLSEIETES